MKKLLVATDLSSRSDRAVLRAIKLAKELKASLIIIHVIDDEMPRGIINDAEKSAKKEIDLCLKGKTKDLKPEIKICTGNVYSQILKVVSEENVDLIILGIHRHTNKNHPIIGHVIERLMHASHKPLLVVRDRFESNYTKILSALDFNNHSKKSLEIAFKLFHDSQFYLLHTYQVPFLGFMGASNNFEEQIIANSVADLKEIVDELLKKDLKTNEIKTSPIKIKQIIKKGYIFDILQEEIQYLKPDLLVLGSHGRSTLARSIVPSDTNDILANPPCDILVVD